MKRWTHFVRYIEDQLLAWSQRRCAHPGHMVAADVLEGCCSKDVEVKYCRRCGAVNIEWKPAPLLEQSRLLKVENAWRLPSPNLWRDR